MELPPEGEQREVAIRKLCVELNCDEFKHQKGDELIISILSGGITNRLYRVKAPNGKSVVIRVFGNETQRFISRDAELFWQSGFLRTLLRLPNALVYEFLDGHTPIQPNELLKYQLDIAAALAQFHCKAALRGMFHLPYATEENHTHYALREWLRMAVDAEGRFAALSEAKHAAFVALDLRGKVALSVNRFLALVERLKPFLPQGPCHNDLLSLNIMRHDTTGALRFIDFEYMRKNYLYFDIANHFCEYAGFDVDFGLYPTHDQQLRFVEHYLSEALKVSGSGEIEGSFACVGGLEAVTVICNYFSVAANLIWSIWAVLQAAYSDIDFDFMDYAARRFKRVFDTQEEFTSRTEALDILKGN